MPTFSDLPNELVAITWGFVDEPADIERFALVSKRVYSLSTPFVWEHERLKQLLPTVSIDVDTDPAGPHDVLELLLHNPRLGFYVHEALIEDWRAPGSERNISLASLTPERIAEFENAVNCSIYVPSSEKERWVREIKEGNPDPIVALIIMRLPKLRCLDLVYPHTGGNGHLLGTLKRMTLSPDGASNPGCSVTQIGPDGSQPIFKKHSPFRHLKEIDLKLGDLRMSVLSNLLQGVEKLESFAFTSSSPIPFDYRRLNRDLLRCARGSLQKLVIHDDSESRGYMGSLTRFQNLVEVSINATFLLGREEEQPRSLADALPTSIQDLDLFLEDGAEPDEVEDVVDQVVQSKVERCPRLETFWVTMVDPIEMDDEDESQLKEKLAEVGVDFYFGEYSNF